MTFDKQSNGRRIKSRIVVVPPHYSRQFTKLMYAAAARKRLVQRSQLIIAELQLEDGGSGVMCRKDTAIILGLTTAGEQIPL